MACLFAWKLAQAGHPVTLMGSWTAGIQALRREGIRVEGAPPCRVSADFSVQGPFRRALVLTKSGRTAGVAERLAGCLHAEGTALSLQNGLGNLEVLAARLGAQRVEAGATTLACTLLGPGSIRPAGHGEVVLGQPTFLELLGQAGISVRLHPDVDGLLWSKLVINAGINAVGAVFGLPNGELLRHPEARQRMRRGAREAAAVALARGVKLPVEDVVAAVEEVAFRTRTNRSSMLQDLDRGLPTEVDAINGAVVRLGRRAGVPTPTNLELWKWILARENRHDAIRTAAGQG